MNLENTVGFKLFKLYSVTKVHFNFIPVLIDQSFIMEF